MIGKTVRIYDLAKELKQDTKRVMEELRREGADVSVPSNSVSKELAEKIRNKYFPKKETAPARAIKVIKKEKPTVTPENETPLVEEQIEVVLPPEVEIERPIEIKKEEKVIPPVTAPAVAKEEAPKTVVRPIKLKRPLNEPALEVQTPVIEPPKEEIIDEIPETPVEVIEEVPPVVEEVEVPEVETPEVEIPEVEAPVAETPVVETPVAETPVVETPKTEVVKPKVFTPTGTKVKVLTLTKEALQKGIKQGERIVTEQPVVQKIERVQQPERGRDRDRRALA